MLKAMKAFSTGLTVFLGKAERSKLKLYSKHALQIQSMVLKRLMKVNSGTVYGTLNNFKDVKSIQDYQDKVPLSDYEDYRGYIDRMVETGEKNLISKHRMKRFAVSSGSVGKAKLVPLGGWNLWVNQCFGVSYPVGCAWDYFKRQGKKLPPQKGMLTMEGTMTPLPAGGTSGGVAAFPMYYIRSLLRFAITSPVSVVFPRPGEVSKTNLAYFKLRFALMDRDVSYLSSIIINILETLMYYMEENWEMLCNDIENGTIDDSILVSDYMRPRMMKRIKPMPERAAELRAEFEKGFDDTIVKRIWPKVGWIYAMGAGSMAIYNKKLGRYTGDLPIYHMGYAASEAMMAVPTDINSLDNIMLPHGCFYEFLPVDAPEDSRPLTMGEVEAGQEYELILTNCSGLYRYRIRDVIKVTGFYNQIPTIQFMYRRNQMLNICSEKTTQKHVEYAVDKMCEELDVLVVGHSIYADLDTSPGHYEVFFEFTKEVPQSEREHFRQVFDAHLEKANNLVTFMRNLKALGNSQVHFLRQGSYDEYWQMRKQEGVNLTQVKPVVLLNTPEKRQFILDRVIGEDGNE